MATNDQIHDQVKSFYGKTLQQSSDLIVPFQQAKLIDKTYGSLQSLIAKVPAGVRKTFYGCGITIPLGIRGLDVLDLGCGSGRDCYVASAMVGSQGSVVGVDMTEEQLVIARYHIEEFMAKEIDCGEMQFLLGTLEKLDAAIGTRRFDLAISNCVINLVPDKPIVLKQVYSSLRDGGEMFFADMYADRRIDSRWMQHPKLFGQGFAGALYVNDFEQMARDAGFKDPRVFKANLITFNPKDFKDELSAEELERLAENTYFSVTYRCFKLPDQLQDCCFGQEDFGHRAKYIGGIEGQEQIYKLDIENSFEKDKEIDVSANTAAILQHSWLKKYFEIRADNIYSRGPFNRNEVGPVNKVWREAERTRKDAIEICTR